MSTLELLAQLKECLHHAGQKKSKGDNERFKNARGKLPAELETLLQEAIEMKWPFVEEKWQYKHSVVSEDKVNTTELIGRHLPQLMCFLKESIMAAEPAWAISIIFLLDRFVYWRDSSHTLLKIAKALHKNYKDTPVAPQIVIRQARIYLNTGKLEKAEYILSSLINNKGATGLWKYQRDCDRVLVQSVSVQVRGQVLQKLGLWLEAAELIWASLVGFYVLPLPDKKGIGTSLGLLANILISMNDKDFVLFQKKPYINLDFLGESSHRLLCAAQAAKMAAVYSQFGSLYVLTHMVTQGTCLLSYSFSNDCPASAKHTYLDLAKEAFGNGLLTKKDNEVITSQQELHTLLRAAYCLATTNKWLYGPSEQINEAVQACQEAVVLFYSYCFKEDTDKNALSSEIVMKLQHVKTLLKMKPFTNSDPRSFIPDSYRAIEDRPVPFTVDDFVRVMERFQKHHKSVCEAFSVQNQGEQQRDASHVSCITAFQTQTDSHGTECHTTCHSSSDYQVKSKNENILAKSGISDPLAQIVSNKGDSEENKPSKKSQKGKNLRISDRSSSSESSWSNLSTHCGSSPVLVDPSCPTEVNNDDGVDNKQNGCHNTKAKSAKTLRGEHNSDDGAGASLSNASHGDCTDFSSLGSNSQQQQSNQELYKIVGREEKHQITSICDWRDKRTRTSSGSISSSDSSFVILAQNRSVDEVLEKSQPVDQNCETISSEDDPGSPFEYLNSSTSSIQKQYLIPSYPTSNDIRKAQTGRIPQSNQKQSLPSTEYNSWEVLEIDQSEVAVNDHMKASENAASGHCPFSNVNCHKSCFQGCEMRSVILMEQDYRSLLSGVCQGCLLRRLPDKPLKLRHYNKAYSALVLKYSKTTDSWTGCETSVYIGEVLKMDVKGQQRQAFRVQYLHQELLLGSYVGKEYLKERRIDAHLDDVERQMTAQFYVMEFNKRLYENNITTQIFYLPSELLLLLEADTIMGCVSVEPYMLGKFIKLTNNSTTICKKLPSTEYGIAFGHFTYEFSNGQEVVVDLQGWNEKGQLYLTDPQIHTLRKPRSYNNFHNSGIKKFLKDQHGQHCNSICKRAALHTLLVQSED